MNETAAPLRIQVDKWQRLSPSALIYYIIKFVTAILKQGFQALAPLAAIFFTTGESRWLIISLVLGVVIILLFLAAFLSFLKFRYRIGHDSFLIQSGVFTRKRLSLNFDRIQNVAIKEPLYFRPFNTVVLMLESAGSSASEVSLAGIPRALAEEIRTTVLNIQKTGLQKKVPRTANGMTDKKTAPQKTTTELIWLPISELVRYGLTNNNMWVFASILAGATAQFDWWEYIPVINIPDFVETPGIKEYLIAGFMAVSSLFLFIGGLMGLSVAGSIIGYYNYRLIEHPNRRLYRTKGLFEKQETSLHIRKIQNLTIKQPWIAVLLKRFNLTLNQVGFGGHNNNGQLKSSPTFIIPSVTESFLQNFSELLYPSFSWATLPLNPISKRYTAKLIIYRILPITLIVSISLTSAFGYKGLYALIMPLLAYPIVEQYRRMFAYCSNGTHGLIQSGFIGTRRTIIPFFKVQTVELIQSPSQQKHALASLRIKMAGTKILLPYIPLKDAEGWRRNILACIETNKRKWM